MQSPSSVFIRQVTGNVVESFSGVRSGGGGRMSLGARLMVAGTWAVVILGEASFVRVMDIGTSARLEGKRKLEPSA